MNITGDMLIGAADVRGTAARLRAFNPATQESFGPDFGAGDAANVDRACTLARAAADPYRQLAPETRARFLESIAQNILDLGDALIERAHQESALPVARLQGERARTVGQLRLFAQVVRDGHYLAATIDPAQPQRQPLPRADLRKMHVAVGPVAVFGASNFPLAFSVAGGDTASALAAGCPVVVKAHNAHLGTSEWVGRAVREAVREHGLPEGVFSLLIGEGNAIGEALVAHPAIQAVGFTGSRRGGLALVNIANARPVPIPVFAEMSSINPMFLLPAALAARASALGRAFADSLTLGVGQFCTNPGLVIGMDGPDLARFRAAAAEALAARQAGTMLTSGIHAAYVEGVGKLARQAGVACVSEGLPGDGCAAQAVLFETDSATFLASPALQDEVFGPASLIVRCASIDDMVVIAEHLEGQLTATLQLNDGDDDIARALLPVLERKAGRILANGFPTGVEVCHAMVHGGPFPATSNAAFTSVGATAIDRFVRPVAYQDLPDRLLPPALQEGNPLGLWRLRDGMPANA